MRVAMNRFFLRHGATLARKLDSPVGIAYLTMSTIFGGAATVISVMDSMNIGMPSYTKVAQYDQTGVLSSTPGYLVAGVGKGVGVGIGVALGWPLLGGCMIGKKIQCESSTSPPVTRPRRY
jgi:hypothetical protein